MGVRKEVGPSGMTRAVITRKSRMPLRLQAIGTVGSDVQSIVSLVDAGTRFSFQEWMVHLRFRAKGTSDHESEPVSEKFTLSRRKAEAEFYRLKRLYRMEEVPYGYPPAMSGESIPGIPRRFASVNGRVGQSEVVVE